MGLTSSGVERTFVSIINGKFTVRASEGTPGAVARQLEKGPNAGSTVYELKYSSLSGMVKEIAYVTKKFGVFVEITVVDDKEYTLQLPWEAFGARTSLIKRLPNVDPSKEVEFCVFKDEKENNIFFLKQDDVTVPVAFSKESPNGMPQAVKNSRGQWDFSKVDDFLYAVLETEMSRFSEEPQGSSDDIIEKAKEVLDAKEKEVLPF